MAIEPRVLKGFRDSLPQQEMRKQQLVRSLETTFSRFGFVPIDTPVLEYTEVLLGKGGGETDKQVYRFTDHGNRDVAMRFDLTVPFARFMAAHWNEVALPFRRYHIDKVFRGENTQRGRFREFFQCDFDVVGTSAVSADFEILLMIVYAFAELGIPGATVHLSHRGVFNRFLEVNGISDEGEFVLRTVDKLRKVGEEKTLAALGQKMGATAAQSVLDFVSAKGTFAEVLSTLTEYAGGQNPDTERLQKIGVFVEETGISEHVVLDPSITRGLDYYTGVVFETFLDGVEEIGSVCSGGRYDDLVSVYSKQSMPGVGASIGLDRLITALDEIRPPDGLFPSADVLIALLSEDHAGKCHALAQKLRSQEIRCAVFPDARKLGQQFAFAEKNGIPFALIYGDTEQRDGIVNLRRLATRENYDGISIDRAVQIIRQ